MNSYTMKTPRIAFGAAAAALTTVTFALLVLAPAGSAPDAAWAAAAVPTVNYLISGNAAAIS